LFVDGKIRSDVTIFDRSDRSRYQACSRAGKLIGVVDRLPDDR
jgi:hypothetical protein